MSDVDFDEEAGEGHVTEVTTENLFERLGSSFGTVCIGILFFFGAFPLLYWNEGRAVDRYEALQEAESQVTAVSSVNLDPSLDGRVVYFTAPITNGAGPLVDSTFGIAIQDGLRLDRHGEMYQWKEKRSSKTTTGLGGKKTTRTTYSYIKVWEDSLIDSGSFKNRSYVNPAVMEFGDSTFMAETIDIGSYKLPDELRGRITWDTQLTEITKANVTKASIRSRVASDQNGELFIPKVMPAEGAGVSSGAGTNGGIGRRRMQTADGTVNESNTATASLSPSGGSSSEVAAPMIEGTTNNPPTLRPTADVTAPAVSSLSYPQIGDQRVSWSYAPETTVTIVGVQNGNTLKAFVSKTGDGGDVLLFKRGNYTVGAMFDEAEASNAATTWILRFVGYAVMTLGLYLVFRPIEVFADIIPCVGSIIGCGIIFMAAVLSAVLSLLTISIAWLAARPKIGGIVLAVSLIVVGGCAFGYKKIRGQKEEDDPDSFAKPNAHEQAEAANTVSASQTLTTVYASQQPSEPIVVLAQPEPVVVSPQPPQPVQASVYVPNQKY